MTRKCYKVLLSFFSSAIFIFLISRSISFENLSSSLKNIHLAYLFLGLICLAGGYFFRIKRSQSMLSSMKAGISFSQSSVPFMIAIAANNVLPLRVGDLLRAVTFSSQLKIRSSDIFATMIIERLLDLLVIFAFLGGSLFFFQPQNKEISMFLYSGATFVSIATSFFTLIIMFPKIISKITNTALKIMGLISTRLELRLRPFLNNFIQTLRNISNRSHIITLLVYTIFAWSLEGGTFYITACAIPNLPNPAAAWLAMPVGTLSTILPSSPGFIGTFHYFVALATRILDNPITPATTFAILIHLALWLPTTLCGGLCFIYWAAKHSTPPTKGDI